MSAKRYVGLASTLHDPALAIVDDAGDVLFAEATERSLQDKRAFNCPPDHVLRGPDLLRQYCGEAPEIVASTSWSQSFLRRLQLDLTSELPPFGRLGRALRDLLLARKDHLVHPLGGFAPLIRAMASSQLQVGLNLSWSDLIEEPIRRHDHHLCHAATACFSSPFSEATCAIVDGFGEWTSLAFFRYAKGRLTRVGPRRGAWGSWHRGSLGMFYGTLCGLTGFDPLKGEEWKVMGLAPHGQVDDEVMGLLKKLIRVEGLELVSPPRKVYLKTLRELETHARHEDAPPLDAANLARTGQEVFSDIMRRLLENLHRAAPHDNLVLGGGCALNSAWNGRILAETPFTALHVPSAPGDDGNALGAAWLSLQQDEPDWKPRAKLLSPYLGSSLGSDALDKLRRFGSLGSLRELPGSIARETARLLAAGKLVGWVQGRAEFGPRALGNRSILADPRDQAMKDAINSRVKFRESFRPFAPAILAEDGKEWFEDYQDSAYMDRALVVRAERRAEIPAVVHDDGTGRLQSVHADLNPEFHALLTEFKVLTGVPLLLNTSFNVMGKPIIHSVEDAVAAFQTTGLDALVLGDTLIEKGLNGAV